MIRRFAACSRLIAALSSACLHRRGVGLAPADARSALLDPSSSFWTTNAPRDLRRARRDEQRARSSLDRSTRLGAARRRSVLQSRSRRLLRRLTILARRAAASSRSSASPGFRRRRNLVNTARFADDSVHAQQRSRDDRVRDDGPEHAHDAALHQSRRQLAPRRAGLLANRPRRRRHGCRRQSVLRIRREFGRRRARGEAGLRCSPAATPIIDREYPKLDRLIRIISHRSKVTPPTIDAHGCHCGPPRMRASR